MARVLVVDDASSVRTLVAMTARLHGHDVLEAADALEAWRIMVAQRPDVIILDLVMPALGGLDICRAMRADPELADLPVIVLTGRGQEDDESTSLQAGATSFMTKPFNPKVLLETIDRLTGGRASGQDTVA